MYCNLSQPTPRNPYPLKYVAHVKFEVAQPIHCRVRAFFAADTLGYAVTMNCDPVTLTFDLEHL